MNYLRLLNTAVLLVAIFAAAIPIQAARAQQAAGVSVSATAPERAYVGGPFAYQIHVQNAQDARPPDLQPTADYDIAYRGPRTFQSTTIAGGQVTTTVSVTHTYAVTPKRTGVLTIPPVEIVAAGRTYRTDPVSVTVEEPPPEGGDHVLRMFTDAGDRLYVGQPIRLTLEWTLRSGAAADFQFILPEIPDSFEVHEAPDPRPAGTLPTDDRYRRVNLSGEPAIATIDLRALGDQRIPVVTVERVLVPRQSGSFRLGPAQVDFEAVTGQRQRTVMDPFWADLSVTEARSIRSEPLTLDVLPLPTEGRPRNFSGLVGAYSIFADARPRNVSVGDPIELAIRVTGPPPLSIVPPLDLAQQPGLKGSRFRLPAQPLLPIPGAGPGLNYTATIRARTPEVAEVPALELSYFDPASGQYKVARTKPVPLSVQPSTTVTLEDEPEPEGEPAPAARELPGGIEDIRRGPLAWSGEPFDLRERLGRPAIIAALAVPPAAYLAGVGLVLARRHAQRDPAARRRRRALRHARRALHRAERLNEPIQAATAVSLALRDLAADLDDRPSHTLTAAQATAVFHARAREQAEPLRSVLETCDRIAFGPASGSSPASAEILGAARRALDSLASPRRDRA